MCVETKIELSIYLEIIINLRRKNGNHFSFNNWIKSLSLTLPFSSKLFVTYAGFVSFHNLSNKTVCLSNGTRFGCMIHMKKISENIKD